MNERLILGHFLDHANYLLRVSTIGCKGLAGNLPAGGQS